MPKEDMPGGGRVKSKAVGMRMVHAFAAAALGAASMLEAAPVSAGCSVFDRRPCFPTVCSVFRHRPCIPDFDPPIGQDLRLTIESPPTAAASTGAQDYAQDHGQDPSDDHAGDSAEHKLDTILDMFAALRACWVPPPEAEARPGMQMSVRLSFKRSGEIIGTPRVTYTTPDTSPEVRDIYHKAIMAALERCTPLPFTSGMGGAIAGRPIAIRYVDNRKLESEHP
jgi:hypothetical protein